MTRGEVTRLLGQIWGGRAAWDDAMQSETGFRWRQVVTLWWVALADVTYAEAVAALPEAQARADAVGGGWIVPAHLRRYSGKPGNYDW
jgi:hypothetical protein